MKFTSDKQRKAVMSKMQERNGSSSASPSTINSIRNQTATPKTHQELRVEAQLQDYKNNLKHFGAEDEVTKKAKRLYLEEKEKAKLLEPFKKDKWSEAEVNLAIRRINNGKITPSEIFKNNKSLDDSDGVELDKSQQDKGLKFLKDKTFDRNGDIKDSSALREREAFLIQQNDVVFSLQDFYSERGNNYVPLYNVSSNKAGYSMDYAYVNGKISILG